MFAETASVRENYFFLVIYQLKIFMPQLKISLK